MALTKSVIGSSGSAGPSETEAIVTTTPVLAPGAFHDVVLDLGDAFVVARATASADLRARLYSGEASRDADYTRQVGLDPVVAVRANVVFDVVLPHAGLLSIVMSVVGAPKTGMCYLRIENTGGSAKALTLTLDVAKVAE